jgi:membrane-associated protein
VRTIAPVLAGVGSMHWRTFASYNIIGGLLWGVGMTVAGYALGAVIPGVDRYIIPIVLVIMLTSVAPGISHLIRDQATRQNLWRKVRALFSR